MRGQAAIPRCPAKLLTLFVRNMNSISNIVLGQAEVDYIKLLLFSHITMLLALDHTEVIRFDISMNDTFVMQVPQCLNHLLPQQARGFNVLHSIKSGLLAIEDGIETWT